MRKKCVIAGVNGQLGSYLLELLLSEGYQVIGLYRRGSTDKFGNIQHLLNNSNLNLISGDITDQAFVFHILNTERPQEIYNTAAQSFVHTSFTEPRYTFEVDTLGVLNLLEAIKQMKMSTKLITCSTSEMFGKSVSYRQKTELTTVPFRYNCFIGEHPEDVELFQDEETPFFPQSPYGVSKLAAHHLIRLYREAYGMWCSGNINFNFESPRRGKEFVTRKITNYIGNIHRNYGKLMLGNLEAKRDWGHAKDVALAMYLSVQQDNPCDYIVSTMNTHTVREFCEKAFGYIGKDYRDYVEVDPKFYRPAEVDYLLGDSNYIRQKLNWSQSVSFDELVSEMVQNDIKINKN